MALERIPRNKFEHEGEGNYVAGFRKPTRGFLGVSKRPAGADTQRPQYLNSGGVGYCGIKWYKRMGGSRTGSIDEPVQKKPYPSQIPTHTGINPRD